MPTRRYTRVKGKNDKYPFINIATRITIINISKKFLPGRLILQSIIWVMRRTRPSPKYMASLLVGPYLKGLFHLLEKNWRKKKTFSFYRYIGFLKYLCPLASWAPGSCPVSLGPGPTLGNMIVAHLNKYAIMYVSLIYYFTTNFYLPIDLNYIMYDIKMSLDGMDLNVLRRGKPRLI